MGTHREWERDIKPLTLFGPSKLKAEAIGNASQKKMPPDPWKQSHEQALCFMLLLFLHREITTLTHIRQAIFPGFRFPTWKVKALIRSHSNIKQS